MPKINKNIVKIIFFLVVLLVTFVGTYFFLQRKDQVTLIQLKKEDYSTEKSKGSLQHFYEPEAGKTITTDLAWRGKSIKNTIKTDSLNERFDYSEQKPGETFRIITIGDSYTFGHNVDTPDNYSEVLEDTLNNTFTCPKIKKFDVINLGVNGYDVEYTIQRLLKRGIKYSPDLVVWLLNDWNFERINEYMIPWENDFITQGVPSFNEDKGIYEAAVKSFEKLRTDYGEKYITDYQKERIDQLKSSYAGPMVIFSFDSFAQKDRPILSYLTQNSSRYSQYFLPNSILDNGNRLQDGHPNEQGHKEIAANMMNTLKKTISSYCN